MSADFALLLAIGVCGFAAFWFLIVFLISAIGGWRALAQRYRSDMPFTGHTWHMRSGRMGGIARYSGVLTVGVNPAGLYLAVMPLFRPGHPPLLIPWPDVSVTSERRFGGTFIVFTFRQAPMASLQLQESFGRQVLETARGAGPAPQI